MAGPAHRLSKCRGMIRSKIKMENPEPYGLILVCRHEIGVHTVPGSKLKVRTMTYNVEDYLTKRYLNILPAGSSLKKAATPFLEMAPTTDVRAPPVKHGRALVYTWCKVHVAAEDCQERNNKQGNKNPAKAGCKEPPAPTGVLAEKAPSVLMQFLHAARYARFDLLCAVSKLAQRIVTWGESCEKLKYRPTRYVNSTSRWRQIGYVGDMLQDTTRRL